MLPDGNYLFAEKVIVAKLKEAAGEDVHVECIGSTDDLQAAKHRFPGLYVLFAGDEVSPAQAGAGKAVQAVQHWIVSAAVRCSDTLGTGSAARETLGKLFLKVLVSLQGYEVAPGMTLSRTTCALPVMYESGHAFLAAEFLLTVDIAGGI
ncbi:MAG: hypothetical protein LBT40_12275 [Deltaproteobacteria bacterium]|jgi:hypothetical protein|nr:hypothetical protein [Deltaproteobacteria bacterium]